jgi:hypothetical protein
MKKYISHFRQQCHNTTLSQHNNVTTQQCQHKTVTTQQSQHNNVTTQHCHNTTVSQHNSFTTQHCDNTTVSQHNTVTTQHCQNSKYVIFQKRRLKILKCSNFLRVHRRHYCSPAGGFCKLRYNTIPVKSASANVSFHTNNSKMPNFEL